MTIEEFDNSLKNDVNMLNIIDSIFKYKRDMKLINYIQNQRLNKLKELNDVKDPEYSKQELRKLRELLLKSATEDFLEKIDKDFDKLDVLESYYKTDIKSILKNFKNLDLTKFHQNEMLKAKKTHEMNINKLLYMYISNYIFSRNETHDLFSLINNYLIANSVQTKIQQYLDEVKQQKIKKKEVDKQKLEKKEVDKQKLEKKEVKKQKLEIDISKVEIFQTLEKHLLYVYTEFYKLYKIEINENTILTQMSECLTSTKSILFITINEKAEDSNFVYTALCVTKDEFLAFITKKENKYPCNYDDPITYISIPIGPPQKKIQTDPKTETQTDPKTETQTNSDVYISYLSAIMIYKQNSKSIFYLLRKKDSPDITNVNTYCDIKDNIPIMYIATCAGNECEKRV
jgi:hypothetical protein